ncbi:hypothetical protein ACHRV1_03670 [Flavobacterium aquidurense]|uniref:hypothetical protein n=1 Tax=Flavobacterium aquidurense TaxID=362413 RepID=UPI003756A269
MSTFIYILSVILIFGKIVIPVYLLFRWFFIIKPLLVNLYSDEKFSFYNGINKSRLIILTVILTLSFFISKILSSEVSGTSDIYNSAFNLCIIVFTQCILFFMFELKTPKNIFTLVKHYFQNPKEIFKSKELVFQEDLMVQPIIKNGFNFKDTINLTVGDIVKQVHAREFEVIIGKYRYIFMDNSSIDNLYRLCNGIEIKEKSIVINIDNKKYSKQYVVEIIAALFNIKRNWNSELKDRTNTKIISFLNSYFLINEGVKSLHINDFTRLFEKTD